MKIPRNPNVFTFSFKYKRPEKGIRAPISFRKSNNRQKLNSKTFKPFNSKKQQGAFKGDESLNAMPKFSNARTNQDKNSIARLKTPIQPKSWKPKTADSKLTSPATRIASVEPVTTAIQFKQFPVLSNVQKEIIRHMRGTNDLLIGAQTGSGKTVGYLMGLMEILKLQEMEPVKDSNVSGLTSQVGLALHRRLNRPRGIILVPNRELLIQITAVAKKMARECKLRIVGIHSKSKRIKEQLATPIDILITTPSAMTLLQTMGIRLSKCSRIILDEADTLYDSSFVDQTLKILESAQGLSIPQILVSATVPGYLKKYCPDHTKILMPSLHKTPTTLKQTSVCYCARIFEKLLPRSH